MERTIRWFALMFGTTVGDWLLELMLVGALMMAIIGVRSCPAARGDRAPCVAVAQPSASH